MNNEIKMKLFEGELIVIFHECYDFLFAITSEYGEGAILDICTAFTNDGNWNITVYYRA